MTYAYNSAKIKIMTIKLSGYDPLGVEKDYWAEGQSEGGPKAQVMGQRPTQQPSAGIRMRVA